VLVTAGYDVSRGAGPARAMDTKSAAASRLPVRQRAPRREKQERLAWAQVSPTGWSAGEDGRDALLQHIPVIFVPERRSTR